MVLHDHYPLVCFVEVMVCYAIRVLFSRCSRSLLSLSGVPMKHTGITYPEVYKDESITEDHFGIQVHDPYRWLEDPDSVQTKAFVKDQNLITEQFLCKCPYTSKIRDNVLYQMKTLSGPTKKFLDPNEIDPEGLTSLRNCSFSVEGTYCCYGLSFGGSDWCELKFKTCESGEDLPDILQHVKFSSISWTKDEKGVFYCMYPHHKGKADGTETTTNVDQKLMYHRLGTPQSDDILCSECKDHPTWNIQGEVSDCGRYLLVTLYDGCEPNNQLFYCDLEKFNSSFTRKLDLIPIVDRFEAVYEYVTNEGDSFVFRTNLDAPMYKIIKINLSCPAREHWEDLIHHNVESLLENCVCVNEDKLIICRLKNVKSLLSVHKLLTGEKILDIDISLGYVANVTGRKRDNEAFIHFTSFLTPGIIYSYDFTHPHPKLEVSSLARVVRESKVRDVDLNQFEVKQVFYESKDGTVVPMFLVLPKNFARNNTAPCQLYGYGGFNISVTPSFSVGRLFFLLHFGGIIAVANIRGGGLYIQGGSNGGLLVCACCNQRPDLFKAAIAQVPVTDLIRFHKFTIGHAWKSDYGDPDSKDDFSYLIRISPLHNINVPSDPNVQYPALLILTADHDDRVVPLHSFKFIATLQGKLGFRCGQTNPILIRIESKAGHGQGKPTSKSIDEVVDIYAFLQVVMSLAWKE
ncbi:Prolyl endopeptidase [Schistosoma japonicum]|nr:Prolyl endopeptidase [Schistosoma japonicum]